MRRLALLILLAAVAATAGGSIAAAKRAANVFPNGSFEESLAGWTGYHATLARVAGGVSGAYAARVTVSAGATDFSIVPTQRPVLSTTAGDAFAATAAVRAAGPSRSVCLRVREWAGSSLAGSAQSCADSGSSWRTLTVPYTVKGSGHQLDAYVFVWGSTNGDAFDVDAIGLDRAGAAPVPAPTPAPSVSALTATAVDNAHIALAWPAVPSAVSYRVLRGSLAVGTTSATSFTDALLWPVTSYGYTVQALAASGSVISTATASAQTKALPSAGFQRPFGATSVWNTPVAAAAPSDAKSATLISWFAAHATSPNLSIGTWSVPVAEAHASDPAYSIPCTMYACTLGAFGPIPVPVTANADPSSDGHLAIVDPATGREWDAWQAKRTSSGWTASAGAAVSTAGNGVAPAGTASGDAANFPLLGGLVRPEEIAQGHIDHALVFGISGVGAGAPVCPATHNAPTSTDANALREGMHLQLDPSVDVSALPIPAYAKVVARAMQKYGMFLRDTAGALGVYAENPIGRGYNPWPSVLGTAAGNEYPSLAGIPWSRFRVVAAPDYPNC